MTTAGEGRAMIENLNMKQLRAILNVIPLELTVLDADNLVVYWNEARQQNGKIAASVRGSDVRECHSASSRPIVDKVIEDLRTGSHDCIEKRLPDRTISWRALRDPDGHYLGALEVIQRFKQSSGAGGD
ncbi:MAG: PAS domain-containing protein [Chloroflexota bacterium]